MFREFVCYERDFRSSDTAGALFMMSGSPSESAYRRRFQTTASGVDPESRDHCRERVECSLRMYKCQFLGPIMPHQFR